MEEGRDHERAAADLGPESLLLFLSVNEVSFVIVNFHDGSG
jgi:hypothetical protein